jgi:two-component system, chemotaxis family, protein-glutamate methylesterase/glutaminase
MSKIRVLVVDDSPIARGVLGEVLTSAGDIEVVGYAADGVGALKALAAGGVDVVTLDIEMPKLDGLEVLSQIMSSKPVAVVMVAGSTADQAQRTLQALSIGAVDFIEKHRTGSAGFEEYRNKVIRAVQTARFANLKSTTEINANGNFSNTAGRNPAEGNLVGFAKDPLRVDDDSNKIDLIAIGASTGGTEAIRVLLAQLPEDCPPVVVAVHMPAFFTQSYASRLDGLLVQSVSEGSAGQDLRRGCVYIAPGGCHMRVTTGRGGRYFIHVENAKSDAVYRPSVNVLFESAALAAQARLRAFVLTGMGDDGARGALAIKSAGGKVWGQNEQTCVVFGMPKAAYQIGAIESLLPIQNITAPLFANVKDNLKTKTEVIN